MQVCALRLFRHPEWSIPLAMILILILNAQRSPVSRPLQAANPDTFDTVLEQWLGSLPVTSLAATGTLPPPGQVHRRPGDGNNDIRIQRASFLAASGSVFTTLDTVRLSIRAPQGLFLSAHQPVLSIWMPISNWGNVVTWNVVEAFQNAARSMLHPYDATETLAGQLLVRIFVNSQVHQLRRLMGGMPIAAWDLHTTPIPNHGPPLLRWSSSQDPNYIGPPGEFFHHRTPGTNQGVFVYETRNPVRFVFQCTLEPVDTLLNPRQLRELVMDMVYIN